MIADMSLNATSWRRRRRFTTSLRPSQSSLHALFLKCGLFACSALNARSNDCHVGLLCMTQRAQYRTQMWVRTLCVVVRTDFLCYPVHFQHKKLNSLEVLKGPSGSRSSSGCDLVCSSWPRGESCVSEVFWRDGLNQTTCKGRTQHASSSQYDAQAAQHAYVIVHPLLARGHMRWHVAIAARTRRATTLASAHRSWGAACARASSSDHQWTATTQTARQAREARPNARVEICRRASAV